MVLCVLPERSFFYKNPRSRPRGKNSNVIAQDMDFLHGAVLMAFILAASLRLHSDAVPLEVDLRQLGEQDIYFLAPRFGVSNGHSTGVGNYSVSFVPLFSLIANFLPNIFRRFTNFNNPESRRLQSSLKGTVDVGFGYIGSRGSFCSPSHIGQWRDLSDCRQFYVCDFNPDALSTCKELTKNESSTKGKEKTNKKDASTLVKQHRSEREDDMDGLETETFLSPCMAMTIFRCPEDYIYYPEEKHCVEDDLEHSEACTRYSKVVI